ncbi:response regulator receiver domain [Streptomyces mirabilis]|uniref:response regulator receiver domain n=1 Tax=Streptomyces mirabilis TaxID=68239 RepID=UPI0036907CEF
MSLGQWAESVALRYLQTVVVVDDRLLVGAKSQVAPVENQTVDDIDPLLVDPSEPLTEESESSTGRVAGGAGPDEDLEGETLLRGFAEYGLVCGFLAPSSPSELEEIREGRYKRLFNRADVVVLDWSLAGDNGRTTRALLQTLISRPAEQLDRLRLVCIYTNTPDLDGIRETLSSDLTARNVRHETPATSQTGWVIDAGYFRIAILGKKSFGRPEHFAIAEVDPSHLPKRIVEEFTQTYHGLMPGFALNSLAILRDNAPLLLQRFNNGLDSAFVSQELLTEQGKRFAVQLMAREVQAILEAVDAGSVLSMDNIQSWAQEKLVAEAQHIPQVKVGSLRSYAREEVLHVVSSADFTAHHLLNLTDSKKLKIGANAKISSLGSLFVNEGEAQDSDEQLGRLSCLNRDLHSEYFGAKSPTLQLGSVLARRAATVGSGEGGEGESEGLEYWLCLQPLCDSERITEPRGFPVVPLREVNEGSPFDVLLLDHGKRKRRLSSAARPFLMQVVTFGPSEGEDVVRSIPRSDAFTLTDLSGQEWAWIAELRPEHAMRISHEMARSMSRIGLDESEWLRLSGINKKS